MIKKYIYILAVLSTIFAGCSASKESTDVISSKRQKNNLSGLSDKEQIKFKFLFHNANKEKMLENYQLAANLFLSCIELAPEESASYYELGSLFESSQEKALALKYSEKAVKLDPENYWYRILYAHSLQKNGDTEQAIKQYEILIKENESNLDLYFDLAGMQLYTRKYKESIETFNLIEKRLGISQEISVQKEKIYVKMGDIDKAAQEIKNLIKEFPDELKYQVILADLYLANDLDEEAFKVYKDILNKDPENPYANLSLYDYYKTKGKDKKATEAIKKAFSSRELDIDTKVKILISYYSITDANLKKEALELNKTLIKTHPEEAKAYTIYADFLFQEKKLEGAKENYLKALEFDNSKFPIWSQLVQIESALQDYEALLRDSKAALELFPNQAIFYYFYGLTSLQEKNYDEAIKYLELGKDFVIDNPPMLSEFYSGLGDAYDAKKEYTKSDKAYEEALKIDPKNVYVLNNYGYYLSLREDKLDRAEELSALSNEIEPDNATFQDTYAWILYKQGKYIQAKDWLEKAVKNDGRTNSVILEHLGDAHAKLNNMKKALEYWMLAKAIGDTQTTEFLDKKIADKKLYE